MGADLDVDAALRTANAAADASRRIILRGYARRFETGTLDVQLKEDATPVTEVDRAAERAIREVIRSAFPDHAILGEEYGGETVPGYSWLVDPIDGTVSFIHHIPMFATLIALCNGSEPVVSVVDLPMLSQRFHAVAGHGSWEGTRRLQVTPGFEPRRSMVCHGDPYQFRAAGRMELYAQLERRITFYRSYTDALGHCLVADGSAALMVDPDLHAWDVAAPSLIVREAGGQVEFQPDPGTGLVTMISGSREAVAWLRPLIRG
ncbi:MAG TPA: inositol monophosphatase family protein [Chloroflexota bacterium]|nr:inositol monophosphatase family protein [Chloroflexota bacterium]